MSAQTSRGCKAIEGCCLQWPPRSCTERQSKMPPAGVHRVAVQSPRRTLSTPTSTPFQSKHRASESDSREPCSFQSFPPNVFEHDSSTSTGAIHNDPGRLLPFRSQRRSTPDIHLVMVAIAPHHVESFIFSSMATDRCSFWGTKMMSDIVWSDNR